MPIIAAGILAGMAEEDVERLKAGFDALNLGKLEAALEMADPEVVFEPLRSPVSGAYHGHDGIRAFFADTVEMFDRFQVEYSEVKDLGDGRVLAIGTMRARVKRGGVETEVQSAGIATFRDGRLLRWKDYGDRAAALEAAGL
jgi:ketosteroid isomerase-like protein